MKSNGPEKPRLSTNPVALVGAVLDDLKGSPALLLIAIVIICSLGVIFVASRESNIRRHKVEMYLLQHCVVGPRGGKVELPE